MKKNAVISAAVLAGIGLLSLVILAVPKTYTVRFWRGDTLLQEQRVRQGTLPEYYEPEPVTGASFIDWDAPLAEVTGDADYHAVFAANLMNHVPYLFPAKDGFLYPDAPFTGDDFCRAVEALAMPGAMEHLPELPAGDKLLTAQDLRPVLTAAFPVMTDSVLADYQPDRELTRADAAAILNRLLCRFEEKVAPDSKAVGFPDVLPERTDYPELMEAAVAHKKGSMAWSSVFLKTALEPGWQVLEGRLRFFDENGYLLRDTVTEDGFTLDAEGWYTSGSEALDGFVTELLASFQQENPSADREALLRCAYDYTRDSFQYLRRNYYNYGDTGWEIAEAETMFQTGLGNCYNFAGAFWAFARGLGYDARAISGLVGGEDDNLFPHGWVRIDLDGEPYFFDPELEATRDKSLNWDLFKVPRMYACSIWRYAEPPVPQREASQ